MCFEEIRANCLNKKHERFFFPLANGFAVIPVGHSWAQLHFQVPLFKMFIGTKGGINM